MTSDATWDSSWVSASLPSRPRTQSRRAHYGLPLQPRSMRDEPCLLPQGLAGAEDPTSRFLCVVLDRHTVELDPAQRGGVFRLERIGELPDARADHPSALRKTRWNQPTAVSRTESNFSTPRTNASCKMPSRWTRSRPRWWTTCSATVSPHPAPRDRARLRRRPPEEVTSIIESVVSPCQKRLPDPREGPR